MLSEEKPRLDVKIYNESTALFVSNAQVRESFEQCDDESEGFRQAIDERQLIAVELDQDDSFVARVVFGSLSSKEKAEWIGHGSRRLKISDGRLVVAGGPSYVSEGFENEFFAMFDVPPGEYFITIYHHLPSMNCFRITHLPEWTSLLHWFKRTRPKRKRLPDWLAVLADIEGGEIADDQVANDGIEELVAFVIQLRPVSNRLKESKLEDDGFLSTDQRIPSKCPLGIIPVGVDQPEVLSAEQIAEQAALEQTALELRFSDEADLATRFRPLADAIHAERYDDVAVWFVDSLQDRVAAWLRDTVRRVRESAQKGDVVSKLPAVHSVWRDGEAAATTLLRWERSFAEGNNLYDTTAVTAETYQGEVRCEFGNPDDYTRGKIPIYSMADVIVTMTNDGPLLAGISLY